MGNWIVILVFGIIAYVLDFFGEDKRAKALRKARAAKKRYARGRSGTKRKRVVRTKTRTRKKRSGGKLSKTELKAVRLRNLAKARRARKAKRK